ncbi:MAG: hypothetical protein BWX83_01243 [Candidatus Cloacimonetes bacterium ADurb.Bin117]|nr:MAG: hypothetical protein BWX83_01243 [Candidatus Cloacimonetes bacterium ADurb.Bin117]
MVSFWKRYITSEIPAAKNIPAITPAISSRLRSKLPFFWASRQTSSRVATAPIKPPKGISRVSPSTPKRMEPKAEPEEMPRM